MKIKLCGIRTIDDVHLINEAKPDFCGFIVEFPQSFRSVSESELRKLTAQVSPEIKKVGVFVPLKTEKTEKLYKLDDDIFFKYAVEVTE